MDFTEHFSMEQESIKFLSPLTRKVSMEPKTLFHFVLSLKDTIKDFFAEQIFRKYFSSRSSLMIQYTSKYLTITFHLHLAPWHQWLCCCMVGLSLQKKFNLKYFLLHFKTKIKLSKINVGISTQVSPSKYITFIADCRRARVEKPLFTQYYA